MRVPHLRAHIKHIGKSEYKHVYIITIGGSATKLYNATIKVSQPLNQWEWKATFDNEREAAIAVDKKLIEKGLEPVNILKKK